MSIKKTCDACGEVTWSRPSGYVGEVPENRTSIIKNISVNGVDTRFVIQIDKILSKNTTDSGAPKDTHLCPKCLSQVIAGEDIGETTNSLSPVINFVEA